MNLGLKIAGACVLLATGTVALAADAPATPQAATPAPAATPAVEVVPGIKLNANGSIDVSDINLEVWHFNGDWTVAEQHEALTVTPAAAATSPNSHVITGTFKAASGEFKLTENVDTADGSVKYSVAMTAEKDVETNELSVAFSLPVKVFAGKQILVNQDKVTLPAAPAAQGQAGLLDQDGVQKIELTTADGTLAVSGNLNVHLQDDREWGDQRYGLRLHFTPTNGPMKEAKIEFTLKWNPAAK